MSKYLRGESPGWHVVSPEGKPVSGPWVAKADAVLHAARKGAAFVAVKWSGAAVVVA